jgi:predicted glycogen debranching enzyme
MNPWNDQTEWLETDGLGGFASGTVGGIRTRRYHGLLLTAAAPPDKRVMLVNGLEAFVTTAAGTFPLSSQRYGGQTVAPEGFRLIEGFSSEPWPTWQFRLPDGTRIEQQLFARHGSPAVGFSWRAIEAPSFVRLSVRPLLSGRDYHSLHHENGNFRFAGVVSDETVTWQAYPSMPEVTARFNGTYRFDPVWYRNFFYQEEWLRGFDASEDLASPCSIDWNLSANAAVLILSANTPGNAVSGATATGAFFGMQAAERDRRARFPSPLHRAADQYLVKRGHGRTIIAGYPWFGDWGRDSFVALRGLCLTCERFDEARQILVDWSAFVSEGMLPNRFPDGGAPQEYNSVDAALWYVIAVHEFLKTAEQRNHRVGAKDRETLLAAVSAILSGYAKGTRFGIRVDRDGLLAAGQPGVQLTWMDAKIDDWVVTPRTGKPVEVQALWLNALYLASNHDSRWEQLCAIGCASFRERFWNLEGNSLFDVIDCDHIHGRTDATFRPNQIFAVGGLPLVLLDMKQARAMVDELERRLWTPMGLRSLAPDQAGYVPQYFGGPSQRDAAYHQGTVWPWLAGPFIEAWVRVRGGTGRAKREARDLLLAPLLRHLQTAGLGHVSEIADGNSPHMPRGCPFQAWSVGELLRIQSALNEPESDQVSNRMHLVRI